MTQIRNLSEFKNIIVSVLVDRGHRKYPVLASIVGFNLPTKLNEHVSLQIEDGQPIRVKLTK
jgi:pyrimidine operon attenuation protein/uracil phosphoribosyltransferase